MLDRTIVPVSLEVMVSVARLTNQNIGCANTLDAEVSKGTCPNEKCLLCACSARCEYSHGRSGLVFSTLIRITFGYAGALVDSWLGY
jgi:hypothetical protein